MAGVLISEKLRAACMLVGLRIISPVISQIFVYLHEWEFHPLTQWQLGQSFPTHAASAEFLREKEILSVPTKAVG